MENNGRKKLFYWDRSTKEGDRRLEIAVMFFFVASSVTSFYTYSTASIDVWDLMTGVFALTISLEEIFSILTVLIPFFFLFPLPFAVMAYYGIRRENLGYMIPVAASLFALLLGLLFFEANLNYLLFSVSFIIASVISGKWANVRYQELKSMRVYRASTRACSRAYLVIKIAVILAVAYTMVSSESMTSDFMDDCMDSYASLSMQLTEKQLRSQVENGIEAQKDVQKAMLSNITLAVSGMVKSQGMEKLGEIGDREIELLEDSSLTQEDKKAIKVGIEGIINQGKSEWDSEVDQQTEAIIKKIVEQADNKTQKEALVEKYLKEMKVNVLNQENVKKQINEMLREPVRIEDREIVIYDFMEETFPLLVVFILWGVMGIWKKLMFLPLVGLYTVIISRVFRGGQK
ncbi:MAG: hypothetical protein B6U72_04980 [Candidatus Altiarchaeales archaeon ex4484_2]|nr:MAG: hypothetical protein B6U72_04980 [Candidatus Altiarchaeales archaeon ex4484_2]